MGIDTKKHFDQNSLLSIERQTLTGTDLKTYCEAVLRWCGIGKE